MSAQTTMSWAYAPPARILKLLSDAGADSAELFIAATGSDEINMLSCFLAKRMGAKHTVARIRGSEYTSENLDFIKNQLELFDGHQSPKDLRQRPYITF